MNTNTTRSTEQGDDDETIGDIGPIDPRMELIAAYLAGFATPEQVAEFERRFVEDDEFFEYAAPAMKVWDLTSNIDELMARAPIELRAERQERLRREAAAAAELTAAPKPVAAPPAQPAAAPAAPAAHAGPKRLSRAQLVATVIQVAAAIVIVAGIALQYMVSRPARARLLEQGFAFDTPPVTDSTARKAGIVPGGATPRLMAVPQPPPPPPTPPETVRVTPSVPSAGRGTPAAPPVAGEGAIMKPMLVAMGQKFSTGPGETKLVELENGAAVLLRPSTDLYYRPMLMLPLPGLTDAMRQTMKRMAMVAIEGEAAIVVPEGDGYDISVSSDAGNAHLESGSFAVRCAKGCAALQLAVRDGQASLSNLPDSATYVFMKKGQLGMAPRIDPPTIVDKSATLLFPQPDSTIRATRKVP